MRTRRPASRSIWWNSHECARCRSNIERNPFAIATTNPTTVSAMGPSAAPRAFVSGTSLSTSAGNSSRLIPTFDAATHFTLFPRGQTASRSSGSPHQV